MSVKKNSMEPTGQNSVQQNAELEVIEKKCYQCQIVKNLNEFGIYRRRKDGRRTVCKACRRKTGRAFISDKVNAGFMYCSKCKTEKRINTENFHPSIINKREKLAICINCHKKLFQELKKKENYRDDANRRMRKWLFNNENLKAHNNRAKEWKKKNPGKVSKQSKEYESRPRVKKRRNELNVKRYWKDPDKYRAKSKAYERRVRKATPAWQSMEDVKKYYEVATKKGLEVDHIVPITSDYVCGLHCVDNFQLLTRAENARKSNKYWPNMPGGLCKK